MCHRLLFGEGGGSVLLAVTCPTLGDIVFFFFFSRAVQHIGIKMVFGISLKGFRQNSECQLHEEACFLLLSDFSMNT